MLNIFIALLLNSHSLTVQLSTNPNPELILLPLWKQSYQSRAFKEKSSPKTPDISLLHKQANKVDMSGKNKEHVRQIERILDAFGLRSEKNSYRRINCTNNTCEIVLIQNLRNHNASEYEKKRGLLAAVQAIASARDEQSMIISTRDPSNPFSLALLSYTWRSK